MYFPTRLCNGSSLPQVPPRFSIKWANFFMQYV